MATPLHRLDPPATAPNASDFLELYAFERPGAALPVDAFVEELKALVRAQPVDATLADALKYGGVARGGAPLDQGLLPVHPPRRAGHRGHDRALPAPRALHRALAAGEPQDRLPPGRPCRRSSSSCASPPPSTSSSDELEAHYACPETMQATYTRLHFQFSSFEEGFVVSALAGEGSLLDVVRDERPWLCQRGIAEYMKRAWELDDDAVAYWRAYEDFRGFVTEPVWDLVRELATDASQQQRAAHHAAALAAHLPEHAPGLERDRRRHVTPCRTFVWPPPRRGVPGRRRADLRRAGGRAGRVLPGAARGRRRRPSGCCSRARRRSRRPRSWCGISSTSTPRATSPASSSRQTDAARVPAIAQAFATESGGYLTRNHMEIWADFAEQALGITREELFRWTPPTETIASRYVTRGSWCHGPPEEAIAAFHLGPPTALARSGSARAPSASARAASPARACSSPRRRRGIRSPPRSTGSASIPTWPTTSSACIARSSRSSRTRGGNTCPTVVRTGPQRQAFKRAYITKILSERRKDEGLLRRMKALSALA